MSAEQPLARLDAEQALLGGLLLDGSALARVNGLQREHFAAEQHKLIYSAILDQAEDDGLIDIVTVSERLQRNGASDDGIFEYLAKLAQNTPSAANVAQYAEFVKAQAERRDLVGMGQEIAQRAAHPAADVIELRREIQTRLTAIEAPNTWPPAIDLYALTEREPERPRDIIAQWLPEGEVTMFASHGGGGKSGGALFTGVCIALERKWYDGVAPARRRVKYVSAEDPWPVLHWRLDRICRHLGASLNDLSGWLEIIDASGLDCELFTETRDGPLLTAMYYELRERMGDAQVLILDGASDLYGANEIRRRDVRYFIRALRRLVPADGAVLLLAHVDKVAARNLGTGTDNYSGSTAWNNSVRARWALRSDGDGFVLKLEKANHAQAGTEIRLRWDPVAHLLVADDAPADGGMVQSIRERQERDGVLAAMRACAAAGVTVPAAMQGPRTAHNVLASRPELPDSIRAGKDASRRFRARLEELRQIPAFTEREIRRDGRHKTLCLVLNDIGSAPNAPNSST